MASNINSLPVEDCIPNVQMYYINIQYNRYPFKFKPYNNYYIHIFSVFEV